MTASLASAGGTTGTVAVVPETGGNRPPLAARIGFGGGDFACNLFYTGTALFLFYFYTDVLGLSATAAGVVYAIGLVWDAVTDPMMAALADRTRSRWGRYRPYLLFGAVPLSASFVALYVDPGLTGMALFLWTAAAHCLFRTCYTVVSVPFSSLQARLTDDANARAGLAGWRMAGAAMGALTVAVATPALVAALGAGDEVRGYLTTAMLFGAAAAVAFFLCFLAIREPAGPDRSSPPFFDDVGGFLGSLGRNGPLVRLIIAIGVSSVALTMFSKNIIYYFKYVLEAPGSALYALAMPGFALVLTVPIWVMAARRTSKRIVWLTGSAIAAVGYLGFFLQADPSVGTAISWAGVISIGNSAFIVMFWSMLPDTVEYGEVATGVRHEAKAFGLASFAQKAALGVNALILGVLLDAMGFVANVDQTPAVLAGIEATMTLIPLTGIAITAAALWGYPIDAATHARLRATLRSARETAAPGAGSDVPRD